VNTKARPVRNLDAILGRLNDASTAISIQIPIESVRPNPHQPRKLFDSDELANLTESIKNHGVLQPLIVRQAADGYELIAGERRWRAAQRAGLSDVPVRVVDFDDQQVVEAALVENIQRSDLNPIEKAQGFKEYLDRFKMKTEQLAERLGIDRTTISNLLGLLNLPAEVQDWVRVGQLTLGHAKVLKGVPGAERQISLAKEAIARSLSVHALEQIAKQHKPATSPSPAAPKPEFVKTAHVLAIEDELRKKLAMRVTIKLHGKEKGQVVVGFDSNDDFERLVDVVRKAA
jgi:ParB family chromosome partitioning protein